MQPAPPVAPETRAPAAPHAPASAQRAHAAAPSPVPPGAAAVIAALQSEDLQRIRTALQDPRPLDRSAVPYAIPLLARDEVALAVVEALRRVAPRIVGMLVDVLLDPEEPVAVRRRIPRILAVTGSARATEGLLRGLEDARSEIRLQCGRALARLHVAHPDLGFDREQVMRLVLTEARRGKRVWESQQILELADEREDSPLVDEVLRDRANRSLEHVFTLLSLVLPLEPLRIAFAGLHTDDPVLRNTALEYLDTVLPPDVRSSLWPLLADRGSTPSEPQPADEALADLIGSNQSIQINLAELRRRLEEGS
jgi:AAA family ATP:ADP antiporter